MKLTMAIDRGNGREIVSTTPRSIIEWERKTGRRVSDFGDGIGLEDFALMAWAALGKPGTYETFLDELRDIEPVAEDPSQPVAEA
jgi:hypothetical protein